MKKFFCLHGLPRAGNTLLGSIINQNPKIALTANSTIANMLGELYMLKHTDIFKNFPDHKSFDNVTKSLIQTYYKDWPQEYIIDRAPWGMPINLKFLKEVQEDIKIIVLVRDVHEILASFIKWSEREPTSFVNGYGNITTEIEMDIKFNFAEDYHQQYLAKPGSRPYCSAMPTKIKFKNFEGANFKLNEKVWSYYNWEINHCILRGDNTPIQHNS